MTLQLTPEWAEFVELQVRAGRFPSADAVLLTALARLRDEQIAADDLDADDAAAIAEAEAEVAAGLDRPWDEVEGDLRRKYLGT